MRGILEQIVAHPAGVDPATLNEIERYTKLFWINNGPYNNLTARKFVLACTPQALAAAAKAAAARGRDVWRPARANRSTGCSKRLQPMFFDPNVDPIVTNKNPGPGKDILRASANNLYSGVSIADLEGFTEKYGLNSRLVKRGGSLIEEVYTADGLYGRQITEIIKHLEAAQRLRHRAHGQCAARAGEVLPDRRAWPTASSTTSRGSRTRPRRSTPSTASSRSTWTRAASREAGRASSTTSTRRRRPASGSWPTTRSGSRTHMPWDPKYRKPSVQGIVANAIDVVIETGDSGPVTPIGINLPNDQAIREKYGSKSVALSNVTEAYEKSAPGSMRDEFSWTPEEADRAAKHAEFSGSLLTDMHEVIGHASGRQAEGQKESPQALIKEHFSALEEGRADLVGLYFIADPKLVELGIFPAADRDAIVRAEYEAYTRNAIVQLRRVRQGDQIEEDHMRNRQMIVRWLMANTKAIEERQRDGKTYLVMVDAAAFREGVGRLLAEVQRIKSEGDYAAAKKLFESYGVHFDPKLRDQVVARVDKLDLPSYSGFVMPKLSAVTGANGQVTDVTISYPMDLKKQMLEYSGVLR